MVTLLVDFFENRLDLWKYLEHCSMSVDLAIFEKRHLPSRLKIAWLIGEYENFVCPINLGDYDVNQEFLYWIYGNIWKLINRPI